MNTRSKMAKLLVVIAMLSFLVGCGNSTIEDGKDMGQAIADFLEIDKVEICTTNVVSPYIFVCFYYEGEIEKGYSYAAFKRKASGDAKLEFAQLPTKLIPMAEGIGGAYYDDYLILVSTNEKLDKIEMTGEIEEEIKVKNTPNIYVVDIFQGNDIAKQVEFRFFDDKGDQIK